MEDLKGYEDIEQHENHDGEEQDADGHVGVHQVCSRYR